MTEIYIIKGSHGDYGDYSEIDICAMFDFNEANKYVFKLTELKEWYNASFEELESKKPPYPNIYKTEFYFSKRKNELIKQEYADAVMKWRLEVDVIESAFWEERNKYITEDLMQCNNFFIEAGLNLYQSDWSFYVVPVKLIHILA